MKKMKRGQLDLSFGLIFSVILIVVFLGFAIYAISSFLKLKSKIETGKFLDEFQADIDKFWRASQGADEVSYILPAKIKEICFINKNSRKNGTRADIYDELGRYSGTDGNLIFYPIGSARPSNYAHIENINIEGIAENPLCFQNKDGRINMVLEQETGGTSLVNIKK
jgi:uncharacterized protein (UPF0333 family)